MAPKITWEIYRNFMLRFYKMQSSKQGDLVAFLREESLRTGYAVSTLRSYVNGNAKKEWHDKMQEEYQPIVSSLRIRRVSKPATNVKLDKHEESGFIINHEIASKAWR